MADPTKTLPPLPQPYATSATWNSDDGTAWQEWHDATDPMPTEWDDEAPDEVVHVYTAEQMRAYAAAAIAAQAKAEPTWSVDECARVLATLRYVQGIAERGEGRPMRDDETLEQFVLGYVQRLEGAPAHGAPDLPHKHDGDTAFAIGNLIYALEMWKVTTPTEAPPAFSRLVAAAQGLVDAESTTAAQPVRQPLTREQEAAPELLEALQDLLFFDNGKPEFVAARAAIAKATSISQEGGAA